MSDSDKWNIDNTAMPKVNYEHIAEIPAGWLDEAVQVLDGAQQILGEQPIVGHQEPVAKPATPPMSPQPAPTELREAKPSPNKVQVTWYTRMDLPEDIEMLQELSNGQWVVTYENKRTQTLSSRMLVENLLHLLSTKQQPQKYVPPAPASKKPASKPATEEVEELEEQLPEVDRDLLDTLGEIMEGWGRRKDGKK